MLAFYQGVNEHDRGLGSLSVSVGHKPIAWLGTKPCRRLLGDRECVLYAISGPESCV